MEDDETPASDELPLIAKEVAYLMGRVLRRCFYKEIQV